MKKHAEQSPSVSHTGGASSLAGGGSQHRLPVVTIEFSVSEDGVVSSGTYIDQSTGRIVSSVDDADANDPTDVKMARGLRLFARSRMAIEVPGHGTLAMGLRCLKVRSLRISSNHPDLRDPDLIWDMDNEGALATLFEEDAHLFLQALESQETVDDFYRAFAFSVNEYADVGQDAASESVKVDSGGEADVQSPEKQTDAPEAGGEGGELAYEDKLELVKQSLNTWKDKGLSADFGLAALEDFELDDLQTLQGVVKVAYARKLHAFVFGSVDEKPTLPRAKAWLEDWKGKSVRPEQRVKIAKAIKWLRAEHKIKLYWKVGKSRTEINIDAPMDGGLARRFKIRTRGADSVDVSKPNNLPDEIALGR